MTIWFRWVVLEDLILHSKYTIVYIVYLLYLHSRFLCLLRLGLCVCNFDAVDREWSSVAHIHRIPLSGPLLEP